jgi:hypothetical protein
LVFGRQFVAAYDWQSAHDSSSLFSALSAGFCN